MQTIYQTALDIMAKWPDDKYDRMIGYMRRNMSPDDIKYIERKRYRLHIEQAPHHGRARRDLPTPSGFHFDPTIRPNPAAFWLRGFFVSTYWVVSHYLLKPVIRAALRDTRIGLAIPSQKEVVSHYTSKPVIRAALRVMPIVCVDVVVCVVTSARPGLK